MKEMLKDIVDLHSKVDGVKVGIACVVYGTQIITMATDVKFRPDDVLVRALPNGITERYRIAGSPSYVAPGDPMGSVSLPVSRIEHDTPLGMINAPPTRVFFQLKEKNTVTIEIFISHSGQDANAAEKLVVLIAAATGLEKRQIRCTSVDGSRVKTGSDTETVVLKEIRETKVFIGLLSKASIASGYVMFELGARWGSELHFAPVLLAPNDYNLLPAWLPGRQAARSHERPKMQQLLREVAEELGRPLRDADAYETEFKAFLKVREKRERSAGAKAAPLSAEPITAPTATTNTASDPPRQRDRGELVLLAAGPVLKRMHKRGSREMLDLVQLCSDAGLRDPTDEEVNKVLAALEKDGLKQEQRSGNVVWLSRASVSIF